MINDPSLIMQKLLALLRLQPGLAWWLPVSASKYETASASVIRMNHRGLLHRSLPETSSQSLAGMDCPSSSQDVQVLGTAWQAAGGGARETPRCKRSTGGRLFWLDPYGKFIYSFSLLSLDYVFNWGYMQSTCFHRKLIVVREFWAPQKFVFWIHNQ